MRKKVIYKIGATSLNIWDTLKEISRQVKASPDIHLDREILRNWKIQQEDWDLTDKDDFFACMEEEEFLKLRPADRIEACTAYEDIEYPNAGPPGNPRLERWPVYPVIGREDAGEEEIEVVRHRVSDLEDSAKEIANFFEDLGEAKASSSGWGYFRAKGQSIWMPQELKEFERNLCQSGRPDEATPVYAVSRVFHNKDTDRKPHRVYYAWHGGEGKDRVVYRSEAEILIECIKGNMRRPKLCMHNVPILLLSIHGLKARILIAHFNPETEILTIKCSQLEQFNGFERQEDAGSKDGRVRPTDFEAKRDLFFRWLHPICQGNTYLEDTKEGREYVMVCRNWSRELVPYEARPKRDRQVDG